MSPSLWLDWEAWGHDSLRLTPSNPMSQSRHHDDVMQTVPLNTNVIPHNNGSAQLNTIICQPREKAS